MTLDLAPLLTVFVIILLLFIIWLERRLSILERDLKNAEVSIHKNASAVLKWMEEVKDEFEKVDRKVQFIAEAADKRQEYSYKGRNSR